MGRSSGKQSLALIQSLPFLAVFLFVFLQVFLKEILFLSFFLYLAIATFKVRKIYRRKRAPIFIRKLHYLIFLILPVGFFFIFLDEKTNEHFFIAGYLFSAALVLLIIYAWKSTKYLPESPLIDEMDDAQRLDFIKANIFSFPTSEDWRKRKDIERSKIVSWSNFNETLNSSILLSQAKKINLVSDTFDISFDIFAQQAIKYNLGRSSGYNKTKDIELKDQLTANLLEKLLLSREDFTRLKHQI